MLESSEISRKIIHVDMDAFFASVEQRDFPEYKGKALVVGGRPERRGVVAAASYEARRYGIRSAMATSQALKRCPDLIIIYPRFDVYKEASQEIQKVFKEYTDLIEPLSLDEAYLDVTQNKKEIPSAIWVAQEIKKKIFEQTDLIASAGVSYNKFLAKVASDMDKPDGLYVITPEKSHEFLMELPIEKFYGIGKVTTKKMNNLGIYFGKDLINFSEEKLFQVFGKSGRYFYQIVRGKDFREVRTHHVRKSFGKETTFDKDLSNLNRMEDEIEKLAEKVFVKKILGRTLTLKVKYGDFQQVTRSQTLLEPLSSVAEIAELSKKLLKRTEAGERPVRLLGISLSNTSKTTDTLQTLDSKQLNLDL